MWADRDQQRGAVLAAGLEELAAEDEEARRVVRPVFDLRREHLQPVDLGRGLAGNGGGAALIARAARAFGVARDRHALDIGQMFIQPAAALAERLRMRADALDVLQSESILPMRQ